MFPVHRSQGLAATDPSSLEPAGPLWQRVPTRDENGDPLADFMMLVPRLKRRSAEQQHDVLARINRVLLSYQSSVVFAELNLRTNLLWVSIRPRLGLCLELPAAIKVMVPEALLVGPYWR
ncbi:hypothetical protein [Acidithiobacillus sp.]